ncbi:MAG: outer membrane lipoprotein-sorting protein [Candidatus Aminicenantes bacterium]|nr:outer membrane lipoprotein-sorting protein [Candidatus Aminicenantes bacterium]
MKKTLSTCILGLFVLGLIAYPAFSMDAKELIGKMLEAQGGKKLLQGIKDSTTTATMDIIQMGISGEVTMYSKEPNMMRMDMEFMGMSMTQAFDGEMAWTINPQTGLSEEMPENMAEYAEKGAYGNDAFFNPEKYGITYSYTGKETIDGKEYHLLERKFADGYLMTFYIDASTYLPYKTKAKSLNQMGMEVDEETVLGDYKKVEGILTPHLITIFQDGEEFGTITVTDIKYNTGLSDDFFKMEK